MRQFRGATVKVSAPQTTGALPISNIGNFVGPTNTGPYIPVTTVSSILASVGIGGQPLLSSEQVNALVTLTVGGEPLLSAADRNTVYETIGIIVKVGFQNAYQYLSDLVSGAQPGDRVSISRARRNLVWMSPPMEKPRQKYEIDVEIKRNKTEVVAGASRCGRCGSEEVMTAQRQTRSADEPMTNFNLCMACGNRWKN